MDSNDDHKKSPCYLTHIGKSRKLFPDFFQILQFWGVTQGISGNYFQYLEKVSGNSPGSLPEFTKFQILFKIIEFEKSFRKIRVVMPLSHDPFVEKIFFHG